MSFFPTLVAELLLDTMNAKTSITAVACLFHLRLAPDRLAAFTSALVSSLAAHFAYTTATAFTFQASRKPFAAFAQLLKIPAWAALAELVASLDVFT